MSQRWPQPGKPRRASRSFHACLFSLPTLCLHAPDPPREASPTPHTPICTRHPPHRSASSAGPRRRRPAVLTLSPHPSQPAFISGTQPLGVLISGLSNRLGQYSRWKARGGQRKQPRVFLPLSALGSISSRGGVSSAVPAPARTPLVSAQPIASQRQLHRLPGSSLLLWAVPAASSHC